MDTLRQFALANWRKLCAWLLAGGGLWLIDQTKTDVVNGTIVVPTEWQPYVPMVLFALTLAAMVLTPSHTSLRSTPDAGPSQPR